jgi:hypothetical protein
MNDTSIGAIVALPICGARDVRLQLIFKQPPIAFFLTLVARSLQGFLVYLVAHRLCDNRSGCAPIVANFGRLSLPYSKIFTYGRMELASRLKKVDYEVLSLCKLGPEALEDKRSAPRRVWNRITSEVHDQIIELA